MAYEVLRDGVSVTEPNPKFSQPRSILDLPILVEDLLSAEQRTAFYRIHEVDYEEAPVIYETEEARLKVAELFGQPLEVRQALDVINRVINEQTLLNPLRLKRPMPVIEPGDKSASQRRIEVYAQEPRNLPENCFFCHSETSTPQDPFGPVFSQSRRTKTVVNAGAYGAWNSLVIPVDTHDPLDVDEEIFHEMYETGKDWLREANNYDPELRFGFIGWNRFRRAGSSQFHPHLQLLTRRKPLQEVENLRESMAKYQYKNGYPYFDDLAYCLRPLGLVFDVGSAHIVFNLVPKKEKEVMIYANDGESLPNGDLSKAASLVMEWWQKKLGVTSFDMAVYLPPLGINVKEVGGDWHNFFPMMRLVDRGGEENPVSDIGVMELYAASVVGSDAFKLAQSFAEYLRETLLADHAPVDIGSFMPAHV